MNHKDTKLIHSSYSNIEELSNIKTETPPIYPNAAFLYDHNLSENNYQYSRKANPNRTDLENKLAILDQANHSLALANGTQAIHAILSLLTTNSHLIISENLYSGSHLLIDQVANQHQIEITTLTNQQTFDQNLIKSKLKPNTQLMFFESPSNPTQTLIDIKTLTTLARDNHILLAIDNSLFSSYVYQPLIHGADIAVQSAAKHLGGHNDLMAGVISVNNDSLYEKLKKIVLIYGLGLTAFDSWLLSRSLDTLGLRITKQNESAKQVAYFLREHPHIDELFYNTLSSIISFSLKKGELTQNLLKNCAHFFSISRNFGCIRSSLSLPSAMSHKETFDQLKSDKKPLPFSQHLIRLSVGIEEVSDIIGALELGIDKTFQEEKITDSVVNLTHLE